jgi:hypothetical protein
MIEKYLEGHKCKILNEIKENELRTVLVDEYLHGELILNEIGGKVYSEDWKLLYEE